MVFFHGLCALPVGLLLGFVVGVTIWCSLVRWGEADVFSEFMCSIRQVCFLVAAFVSARVALTVCEHFKHPVPEKLTFLVLVAMFSYVLWTGTAYLTLRWYRRWVHLRPDRRSLSDDNLD
jgi:hypothetical protein